MKSREEEIRYRAHLIWLAEGQPDGRDKEHWKQAQAIVDQMLSIGPRLRKNRGRDAILKEVPVA